MLFYTYNLCLSILHIQLIVPPFKKNYLLSQPIPSLDTNPAAEKVTDANFVPSSGRLRRFHATAEELLLFSLLLVGYSRQCYSISSCFQLKQYYTFTPSPIFFCVLGMVDGWVGKFISLW